MEFSHELLRFLRHSRHTPDEWSILMLALLLARAAFFKQPFKPVQSETRLVEYTVLDVEPTSPRGAGGDDQNQKKGGKSDVTARNRVNGAMIEVVLSADFGVNDNTHTAFSQLVTTLTCQGEYLTGETAQSHLRRLFCRATFCIQGIWSWATIWVHNSRGPAFASSSLQLQSTH